jgi:hypothetical protein
MCIVYSESQIEEKILFPPLCPFNLRKSTGLNRFGGFSYYLFQSFKVEPLLQNGILEFPDIDLIFDGVEYF